MKFIITAIIVVTSLLKMITPSSSTHRKCEKCGTKIRDNEEAHETARGTWVCLKCDKVKGKGGGPFSGGASPYDGSW